MSSRDKTPSFSPPSISPDVARRQALLSEEERQQQAMARQREIALLRRSFTSPTTGIATSQTSLLGG